MDKNCLMYHKAETINEEDHHQVIDRLELKILNLQFIM
jgi:hypothetical protein